MKNQTLFLQAIFWELDLILMFPLEDQLACLSFSLLKVNLIFERFNLIPYYNIIFHNSRKKFDKLFSFFDLWI